MNQYKYNWYMTSSFYDVEPLNIDLQRRLYAPIGYRSMKFLQEQRRKTMERHARYEAWAERNRRHVAFAIKHVIKDKLGLS